MERAEIKKHLERIEESVAVIERLLDLDAVIEDLKTPPKKKKNQTLKGAIPDLECHSDVLKGVPQALQLAWVETYKDTSWIISEIQKCKMWCLSKGVHTKQWSRRLNSWLSNAKPPETTQDHTPSVWR